MPPGLIAQRQSASLTRRKSLVRSQLGPPTHTAPVPTRPVVPWHRSGTPHRERKRDVDPVRRRHHLGSAAAFGRLLARVISRHQTGPFLCGDGVIMINGVSSPMETTLTWSARRANASSMYLLSTGNTATPGVAGLAGAALLER